MGSQALIQSAASNNCHKLRGLLQTGAIYVDVVDWLGHSALFAAAVSTTECIIRVFENLVAILLMYVFNRYMVTVMQ